MIFPGQLCSKTVWRWSVLATLMLCLLSLSPVSASTEEECDNPDAGNTRIVTREELATKRGENGSEIWLSILGEVYNVTAGQDYYAPGSGYSVFSGRDASVPFCNGKFTEEEAERSPNEALTINDLPGLVEWRDFYKNHEQYTFVGYLLDPRYYDEEGKQTTEMEDLLARIETAKIAQEERAKERRNKKKKVSS